MPSGLLLLPFLGGFVFLLSFRYTRFAMVRSEARRLIIFSLLIGVLLGFISRVLVLFIIEVGAGEQWWILKWKQIFPSAHSGTATISFLIGLPIALFLNKFFDREKAQRLSIQHFGHHLDRLFSECLNYDKQIQLTLSDGKHYIGYIREIPAELGGENSYFTMIPTLSGYREPKTKAVVLNTSYVDILEDLEDPKVAKSLGLERDDFRKYLRAQDITMAGVYDPDVAGYFEYKVESEEDWNQSLKEALSDLSASKEAQ